MADKAMTRRLTAAVLLAVLAGSLQLGLRVATAQQAAADGTYTLKVQSDIVLTNVVVRDKKTGEVVKGLKASDFTVLENGKPQNISSFDYQSVDEAVALKENATVSGKTTD
jgi:hypothetical protein